MADGCGGHGVVSERCGCNVGASGAQGLDGGAQRVLGAEPSRWEDDKVRHRDARLVRRAGEHGEDGRVWVVDRHSVHCMKAREVVLVRGVVAMPRDHIWQEGSE